MNCFYRKNKQKGFIALVTAMMISVILLVIICTLSFTAYNSRFNRLSDEFKAESYETARACADKTILYLVKESSYRANATTTINDKECRTGNIERSGDNATFTTQAIIQDTYTNLKVTVNLATLAIVSMEEKP